MVVAVGNSGTMLRGGGGLGSHLKLGYCGLGKPAIVIVRTLLLRFMLLRFRQRELLLRLVCLVAHRGSRLRVLAAEVDAGGCWGDLALAFEQT